MTGEMLTRAKRGSLLTGPEQGARRGSLLTGPDGLGNCSAVSQWVVGVQYT